MHAVNPRALANVTTRERSMNSDLSRATLVYDVVLVHGLFTGEVIVCSPSNYGLDVYTAGYRTPQHNTYGTRVVHAVSPRVLAT